MKTIKSLMVAAVAVGAIAAAADAWGAIGWVLACAAVWFAAAENGGAQDTGTAARVTKGA